MTVSAKQTVSDNFSTPAGEVPPAAQAVGFTTVALNSDFTQSLPKNWLGGCPNGADGSANDTSDNKGHIWYNNIWWQSTEQPCTIGQVTDPAFGGLTVDIAWQVHYQGTPGGDGHTMQSAGWNWPLINNQPSVGFAAPNNAYYEISARVTPKSDSAAMNFVTWAVTGITGGDPGIEWDIMEMGGNGGGNGAVHNWGAGAAGGWLWTTFLNGINDLTAAYPNYDPTQYNTFGLRTVSDGNGMRSCSYINNHLIRCSDLPGGLTAAEKTQRTLIFPSTVCYWGNHNNSCPLEGQMQHTYIRSIRVWSCSSWATTECNLSTIPGP